MPRYVKQLMASFGLAVVLVLLFWNTRSAGLEDNHRVLDTLGQLKQVDASLNEDVLKCHAGILTHYDTLIDQQRRLQELASSLEPRGKAIEVNDADEIERCLHDYSDVLTQKEMLIEEFKSSNALLRNS